MGETRVRVSAGQARFFLRLHRSAGAGVNRNQRLFLCLRGLLCRLQTVVLNPASFAFPYVLGAFGHGLTKTDISDESQTIRAD